MVEASVVLFVFFFVVFLFCFWFFVFGCFCLLLFAFLFSFLFARGFANGTWAASLDSYRSSSSSILIASCDLSADGVKMMSVEVLAGSPSAVARSEDFIFFDFLSFLESLSLPIFVVEEGKVDGVR